MNSLFLPIVGNLTDDPELRYTPAGLPIVRFTIAHNPRRLDRTTDKWEDGEPTFVVASAFRHLAEHLAESLQKGTRVIALGSLRTARWDSDGRGKTPKGQKISQLELDVMACGPDLSFATAKVTKQTRADGSPDDPWATASKSRPAPAAGGPLDDEPPF